MRASITATALMLAAAAACAQTGPNAPTHRFGVSRIIPDQYIVVFKRETTEPGKLAAQLAQQHGGKLLRSTRT